MTISQKKGFLPIMKQTKNTNEKQKMPAQKLPGCNVEQGVYAPRNVGNTVVSH